MTKTSIVPVLLFCIIVLCVFPVLAVHAIYKTIFWLFSGRDESWREYVWED